MSHLTRRKLDGQPIGMTLASALPRPSRPPAGTFWSMAKILLAHPLFLSKSPGEQRAVSPYFPLGLLYLAAYVRDRGHDVAIFDGTFCEDEQSFTAALAAEAPDVVGISALQTTREMALVLAQMASDHGSVVVLGGPDPTRVPKQYGIQPAVDIVVHHEGEQTIARLLDLADTNDLTAERVANEQGIAFRRDGQVVINPARPPIQDLDSLPLPARDLIDMDRYLSAWEEDNGYSSITVSATRGCAYGCQWCEDSVHGPQLRQRSPESVAAEVRILKETYQPARLRLVDDVDGMDSSWFDDWVLAGADLPFEPLNRIKSQDLPLLDMADSL
jgi:anaerobic magnesium-protoporphyrin IX monomethyl ester cyclase